MIKRVLLTGISGFVGHHIFEHIMKTTDWHVVGLHRSSHAGSLQRLEEVLAPHPEWRDRLTLIHHDLRDEIHALVDKQIGNIDYVLHVGASSHVDRSIASPKDFVLDNVIGTVNLLDWARTRTLEKFLYFSTDEVFGNAPEGVNHAEGSPHLPRNPYAASKAAAEDICYSYHITYGIPLLITNTMNIIGERQHPEKFVPLVIGKVLSGEKLFIHSDPTKTKPGQRHYLHARNCAAATLFVLQNGMIGERYNVVGEVEYDNLQIAQEIEEAVNKYLNGDYNDILTLPLNYELVDFHSSRPGHDLRYSLDGSKLAAMGYKHPVNFAESLRKTVEWSLDNDRWLAWH